MGAKDYLGDPEPFSHARIRQSPPPASFNLIRPSCAAILGLPTAKASNHHPTKENFHQWQLRHAAPDPCFTQKIEHRTPRMAQRTGSKCKATPTLKVRQPCFSQRWTAFWVVLKGSQREACHLQSLVFTLHLAESTPSRTVGRPPPLLSQLRGKERHQQRGQRCLQPFPAPASPFNTDFAIKLSVGVTPPPPAPRPLPPRDPSQVGPQARNSRTLRQPRDLLGPGGLDLGPRLQPRYWVGIHECLWEPAKRKRCSGESLDGTVSVAGKLRGQAKMRDLHYLLSPNCALLPAFSKMGLGAP